MGVGEEATMTAAGVPETADVVVIGGGVNGASTAFQLTKRGVRNVVLLERRQLGAGASGKSGALVRCHYRNPYESKLTYESLKVFTNWEEEVGVGSPGFEATGFIQVVAPADEANLRANVADQQAIGIDTRVVSADELRAIEPLMRTDDLSYCAYEPGSGFADPNATLYGFAAAAEIRGATICTNTAATAIVRDARGVSGVETDQGTIATRTVVLAGGAWADRLLTPLGIDLGLTPKRAQVVLFRWPPSVDPTRRHCTVIDGSGSHSWFRVEGFASTLVGGEGGVTGVDPDTLRETVDEETVDATRRLLAHRFPAFAQATMRGGWAGVYMVSPDSHPIIDHCGDVPGLYVMAGDSGTSFKTSPAIGIVLAEWITEGKPKLLDMTPFRMTRFAEGKPWVDERAYSDTRQQLTISR
jgi:sarcosine oxidase, subunit beta